MDRRMMTIVYIELRLQLDALLGAADELAAADRAPVTMPRTGFIGPTDNHWVALQHLLVAGANVSKLLWGSGGKKEEARRDLRASLGVGDSSPLRDPDLRNDFEHIDERIDMYFSASPARGYWGRNIGKGLKTKDGTDFGHYDPESGEVAFFSHVVNVPAIVEEARAIRSRLEDELWFAMTGRRERWSPGAPLPQLSNPPTEEELRAIGLDPDYEIRPPGAPPRFRKKPPSAPSA